MQDNIDDMLGNLEENTTQISEDTTEYIRQYKGIERVDFTLKEITTFTPYPSVKKEYRYSEPLLCGHVINGREIKFGGYCQRCEKEHCNKCERMCMHCSKLVCVKCAKYYKRVIICKTCKRIFRLRKWFYFIISPFLEEPVSDEPETLQPDTTKTTESESSEQRFI